MLARMVRAYALCAALVASAPSCTDLYSVATHGFAVPTTATRNATGSLVGNQLRIALDFQAHNPNDYPLTVTSVDYDVHVQEQPAFSGTQPGVSVGEHADGELRLSGAIPRNAPALANLTPGQRAPFVLSGTIHLDTPAGVAVDVEFSMGGTFVVPGPNPNER